MKKKTNKTGWVTDEMAPGPVYDPPRGKVPKPTDPMPEKRGNVFPRPGKPKSPSTIKNT